MSKVVIIEDESHAEWQKERFKSVEDAFNELRRRAELPWNQDPNRCPCTSWETCDRTYYILEFDDSTDPWTELSRLGYQEVSARGVMWSKDFANGVLQKSA